MGNTEIRLFVRALVFASMLAPFALDSLAADATTPNDPLPTIGARIDEMAASGELSGVVLVARNGDVLFDMSSGLGDFFGERYDATPKDEIVTLTDYLELFAGQPLEFEPGTSKRYSNAGYIVLGLIIEELTGMPYDQALTTRVFKPAAMTGSAVLDRHSLGDEAATGYTRDGWMEEMSRWMEGIQGGEAPTGARVPNTDTLPGRGSSAGGTYSTARDLLAFDRALAAGALCNPAYWRGYGGLGFAGGAAGVNAALEADWDKGWTVVVLTNLDPPSAMRAARSIREMLSVPAD